MVTYKCCNGRLGENISYIYGVFKFCKINGIDYHNICIDLNYKSVPFINNKSGEFVFKENREMFSNIDYCFRNKINTNDFFVIDCEHKINITSLYNYYKYNNQKNILFKNYWSLDDYFIKDDYDFDLKLLDYICRPEKIVHRLRSKYKKILENSIAIHIRREDYLALENNKILKSEYQQYYNSIYKNKKLYKKEEIIDIIIKNFREHNILIFTDDVNWYHKNLDMYKNTYCIEGNKAYEDMILMSLCDYVIRNPGSYFSQVPYLLHNLKV